MTLLELERVDKRSRPSERVALEDVSLVLEAGEMVTIWGERRSGRSTLLRVAAGVERPDRGVVRFAGRDLAAPGGARLGSGISYCRTAFQSSAGQNIVEQLAAGQLARGTPRSTAQARAWQALERVSAEPYATRIAAELNGAETIRVSIARALTSAPGLLVIDEPIIGVELLARDGILDLLRSIADEGVAVLTSTSEGTGLLGADRVLSLGKGKLRGETIPELAQVTDISRRRRTAG